MDKKLLALAEQIGELLQARGWLLATAESCTSGQVAEIITAVSGSSHWFDRGFVTYSNAAKEEMLDVPHELLEKHGAVSTEVVCAMAEGALKKSRVDISLAITGIAGPGGGTLEKPVGTIFFAWASSHFPTQTDRQMFTGDRLSVRSQAAAFSLEKLKSHLIIHN